jgi:hypothetical protein
LVLSDCTRSRLCSVKQDGSSWTAVCDASTANEAHLSGTISGSTVSWSSPDSQPCTATLQDGRLSGSCQSDSGSCAVSSDDPLPSPTCTTLPSQLLFDGCDLPTDACDVVQNGCNWQASCNDGATVFGGSIRSNNTLRWTLADGRSCRAPNGQTAPPAGTYSTTCTPPQGQQGDSCTVTTTAPEGLPTPPTCQPLPSTFVLQGCDFQTDYAGTLGDAICNVVQNGCVWQADCGDTILAGRANGSAYTWRTDDGSDCAGVLAQGKLSGSCEGSAGLCAFRQRDPAAPQGCLAAPQAITVDGCQLEGTCNIVQDGCNWQASCNSGAVTYDGVATDSELKLLTHISDVPYWCTLDETGTGWCSLDPSVNPDDATGAGLPPYCDIVGEAGSGG